MNALVAGVEWPAATGGGEADLPRLAAQLHDKVRSVSGDRLRDIGTRAGLSGSELAGRAFLHEAVNSLVAPGGLGFTRVRWDGIEYVVAVGDDTTCLGWELLVALSRAGIC